jgi:ribosome maturation factor RimP
MQLSAMAARISPIIEPTLDSMGYELVRVYWTDGANRTLQIMAERKDGKEITVDDCAEISHTVSALLDVDDPIDVAYRLEVSSPGIDRPLTKLEHFAAAVSDEVKIEMALSQKGRKRFRGVIVGVEGEMVRVNVDTEEYVLPFADMQSAKLVLTDALVKKVMKAREAKQPIEIAKTTETN